MQQPDSDNPTADGQKTSNVNSQQIQRQQLQVIPPARVSADLSGTVHQGILYQEAMQNFQNPQSFPLQGSTTNTINTQQQMAEWTGDGRFVQQPVRYSSTLQPVYDFRGQLLTPGNLALHPANVNQIIQYSYGSPQQRPCQGPVAQFAPWQTIFTPNQGLAWVPSGIQGATIEGQGNQMLNRNLQHDPQPGIFIHNAQPQIQQVKHMEGQHPSIPKTIITENFSTTLPNSANMVTNNVRMQQQAQMQAFQTMLQTQKADAKVLAKNSARMGGTITTQKNIAYHTNVTTSLAQSLPPVHGSSPGQIIRAVPSFNAQDYKRMKQFQVVEESPKNESLPNQQVQKRYQQIQGNPNSVPVLANNSNPVSLEGLTLPTPGIHILQPGAPVPQGIHTNPTPVATTGQQQLEKQDSELKKSFQEPRNSTPGDNRSEEPHGSFKDLGQYMKEEPNVKEMALTEAKEISGEDMDVDTSGEKDSNSAILSKATVLVKPQIMTCSSEGSLEPTSLYKECEDTQLKNEDDGNIFDDGEELGRKTTEDSEKESEPSSNGKQTKPNLSKWTVSDVYEFIKSIPGCSEYAEDFVSHDIDGEALILLKTDHLVSAMSMTLGPAMKIISRIKTLREDTGNSTK